MTEPGRDRTERVPDRYSASYRVRFDEGGPDGLVRTSVLLRYAQDLAGLHSSAHGFGRDWYAGRAITWLVRAAEIAVLLPITVGDEVIATTSVVGWRRVWARRRTDVHDAAGTLLAWINIDWVLIDGRGTPARIPPEFDPIFRAPPADFPLARVRLGDAPAEAVRSSFRVRPQELDPMEHVNNAVYADWFDEAVLGAGGTGAVRGVPRLVRLEYARAVEADARIETTTWPDPGSSGGWSARIADGAGTELLRARFEPT